MDTSFKVTTVVINNTREYIHDKMFMHKLSNEHLILFLCLGWLCKMHM